MSSQREQVECVCLRVDWRDCHAEVDETDILCALCAETLRVRMVSSLL